MSAEAETERGGEVPDRPTPPAWDDITGRTLYNDGNLRRTRHQAIVSFSTVEECSAFRAWLDAAAGGAVAVPEDPGLPTLLDRLLERSKATLAANDGAYSEGFGHGMQDVIGEVRAALGDPQPAPRGEETA